MTIQIGSKGWAYGGQSYAPYAVVEGLPRNVEALAVQGGDAFYVVAPLVLSEAVAVVPLTASGIAFSGPCEFRGIKVRAYNGGPQTALLYDATSATGTPIDTIVFDGLGTWLWDRDGDGANRGGTGGRRICANGCYAAFSGGVSRTADIMVQGV